MTLFCMLVKWSYMYVIHSLCTPGSSYSKKVDVESSVAAEWLKYLQHYFSYRCSLERLHVVGSVVGVMMYHASEEG